MEMTPERIAQSYSAAMDSVNLINDLKAKGALTEEELDRVSRNQEHLSIMLGKDFWTTEDLAPFVQAVAVVVQCLVFVG